MKVISVFITFLLMLSCIEGKNVSSDQPNSLASLKVGDVDSDGDGYCKQEFLGHTLCQQTTADCDDSNEKYNSAMLYYEDSDGDGFGNPSIYKSFCLPEHGWVSNSSDCNTNDINKFRIKTLYLDSDRNGSGGLTSELICIGNSIPDGYSENNLDNLEILETLMTTLDFSNEDQVTQLLNHAESMLNAPPELGRVAGRIYASTSISQNSKDRLISLLESASLKKLYYLHANDFGNKRTELLNALFSSSYSVGKSDFCGVDLYNEKSDLKCPGSVAGYTWNVSWNYGYPSCPGADSLNVGPYGHIGGTPDTWWSKCVKNSVLKSCRLPEFGIESFKSCQFLYNTNQLSSLDTQLATLLSVASVSAYQEFYFNKSIKSLNQIEASIEYQNLLIKAKEISMLLGLNDINSAEMCKTRKNLLEAKEKILNLLDLLYKTEPDSRVTEVAATCSS